MLSWSEVRKLYQEDREYFDKYLQLRSRCYNVFNAQQMDGIPERKTHGTDIGALRAQRDTLVQNLGYTYREEPGSSAFSRESTDTVIAAPGGNLRRSYGYMATFLHESAHASGHESRLNRDLSGSFDRKHMPGGAAARSPAPLRRGRRAAADLGATGVSDTAALRLCAELERCPEGRPEELIGRSGRRSRSSDYLLEQGGFQQLQTRQEPVQAEPDPPSQGDLSRQLPKEKPQNAESLYAKILRPDFTGEAIPVFYDDLQRCRAALSAGMPGMYVPLTEEQV